MAKSSKLEDYWRQHGIENLFKDLTHILVQRMPVDPVSALVQHLQKKYPKSFKNVTDENSDAGIISKRVVQNLQLRSTLSPKSDTQNETASDLDLRRRSLNQSQVSGIAAIPTVGSAFTDLIKRDMNTSKTEQPLNFRQLLFANRIGQQAIKLGKDIQTDHDILEEELIKPSEMKNNESTSEPMSIDPTILSEDLQTIQTHDQPSLVQLIKYKQQIRNENDRRVHRQKLAELAFAKRDETHLLQSDVQTTSEDIGEQVYEQRQRLNVESNELSMNTDEKPIKVHPTKLTATNKEEEEILDDENVFQERKQRTRMRNKKFGKQIDSNTPRLRENPDIELNTMRRFNAKSAPIMQFSICKKCGAIINDGDVQLSEREPVSTTHRLPTTTIERGPKQVEKGGEDEAVDDWFESASTVSGPRQMSPWTPDENHPLENESNNIRRNLFQPIQNQTSENVECRPPIRSFNPFHDRSKMNVTSTPRMSETGMFTRSPDTKIRRSSLTRNVPSPVVKQASTSSRSVSRVETPSPLLNAMPTSNSLTQEQHMSGWGFQDQSRDDFD